MAIASSKDPRRLMAQTTSTATEHERKVEEIRRQRADIDDLDREIKELENALAEKTSIRALKVQCLNKLEDELRPPIESLPDDILVSIFEACIPPPFSIHDGVLDPEGIKEIFLGRACDHPSVLNSHVCRRWRSVALLSPSLWSQFALAPPNHTEDEEAEQKLLVVRDILETWLLRSSGCLLDVSFLQVTGDTPAFDVTGSERALEELVHLFCQSSERWERLSMVVMASHPSCASILNILQIPGDRLPNLRSFSSVNTLNHAAFSDSQHQSLLTGPLFSAPNLREVLIWPNVHIPIHLDIPQYSQITSLGLCGWSEYDGASGLTSLDALDLLRGSPNLSHCELSLRSDGHYLPLAQTIPPIHLPHLISLALCWWPPASGFAANLVLPSLKSLSLPNIAQESADMGDLFECVMRFGGQVETLVCDPSFFAKLECPIELALQPLQHLKKLALTAIVEQSALDASPRPVGTELLEILSLLTDAPADSQVLCPALEEFECGVISNTITGQAEVALCGFLNSRSGRPQPVPSNDLSLAPPKAVSVRFAGRSELLQLDDVTHRKHYIEADSSGLKMDIRYEAS